MNSNTGVPALTISILAMLLCALPAGGQTGSSDQTPHPLDPLSESEYATVLEVLGDSGLVSYASRYPLVTLDDPPKEEVWAWQPGDSSNRRAFAVVKDGEVTFEAVVDLTDRALVSRRIVPDVQPGILLSEEWTMAQFILRSDSTWHAALAKRGVTDFKEVTCVPNTVGFYGLEEERGRRLARVVCYYSKDTENFWGRPIEGLIALVDFNKREMVRLFDTGAIPIPPSSPTISGDSSNTSVTGGAGATVQPIDPTYTVEGNSVTWNNWSFHYRIDPRLGLVVSTVRYNDRGRERAVLYQGSLSELFVPYMDPSEGWYFKTYLDAGEYGIGKLAAPLESGTDCPANGSLLDAVFADDWGDPYVHERAACLFERYAGAIAWRHYEAEKGQTEVKRRTDLVLRSIAVVGNYDYVFDWVFRQDGSIQVVVGATGIEQVKAVHSSAISDDVDGRDLAFGRMVAPHTVAVNHDHYFSFRLDLDVDGLRNSFVLDRLISKRVDKGPRRSVWVLDSRTIRRESRARARIDLERPALWRVTNPNALGPVGYPVSYQLKPSANAVSLLTADDFPQLRAGFTDYHLWVTRFRQNEKYAAGMYPNQSKGGDGLPAWISADRSIENADIVLWYTLGFHHVVRAEDWPVLPTTVHQFEIRPFDFFERNPTLDVGR